MPELLSVSERISNIMEKVQSIVNSKIGEDPIFKRTSNTSYNTNKSYPPNKENILSTLWFIGRAVTGEIPTVEAKEIVRRGKLPVASAYFIGDPSSDENNKLEVSLMDFVENRKKFRRALKRRRFNDENLG